MEPNSKTSCLSDTTYSVHRNAVVGCRVIVCCVSVSSVSNKHPVLYHIKNQQDATLAVLFIIHCNVTLHVSDAFCVHHQEY